MGADEVGVVDPTVIDVFAGLHLRLDFFDNITFLDDVMLHFDPGDLCESFCQRLTFVFMRRDGFRDDADVLAGEWLRRIDEPFHFLQLVFL